MEPKKKNFLENLRLKTKFPNLKKYGKKAPAKQGKKLAYRRSISVPDLRFVPSEPSPSPKDNGPLSAASGAIFFGASSGQSDSDSIASGSNASGPLFTDRLIVNDLTPVIRQRLQAPVDNVAYRMSPPVEKKLTEDAEKEGTNKSSGLESKVKFSDEPLCTLVDKSAKTVKGNLPTSISAPVPAPRSITSNIPAPPPRTALSEDKEKLFTDRLDTTDNTPTNRGGAGSGGVAAGIARASSFGDQVNLMEKQTPLCERKKTPPAIRANVTADKWSLPNDSVGTPAESVDSTSLDSTCSTPTDEQVTMPWTTDSDDLEREPFSPLISKILSMEEAQLEGFQEDMVESEQSDLFDQAMQDLSDNPAMMAGPEVPTFVPLQRYLLTINLKEGRNLVIRDKRSGTSDPYVKFKLEGKLFYKSKVVYKNLNPRWNESFSHPLRDREHAVEVRVYDKNRTTDEFMGSSTIAFKNLELYKTREMELRLADPKSKEEDMGVIVIDICLMYRDATIKRTKWPQKKNKGGQQQNQVQAVSAAQTQKNQTKSQLWNGVYGISLVEGQDLPQHGHGDVYVRFRLGDQKYKSKNLCIQANPQWREQFDFNQFEDNQEPLQVEVFSKRGRKAEESWGMFEIDLSRLWVNESHLYTHVLDPGKGRLVFLVTLSPCWGVSVSDIHTAPLDQPDEKDSIVERFSLKNSHNCVREVGFLQVKVIKATDVLAADLHGKSDPFCVVELGNSRLQTQTLYKTLNPEWNKVFTFPIKDIHDVVELTVMDENGDRSPNFLGKVAIPLLTIRNGQQICQVLKKEGLGRPSKGTITLVLEVIYNKVRAGVRTFHPKEPKFIEENPKFNKKVLAQNIYRVRKISTAALFTLQYIKSCFQWESTQRSLIAFLIFLVTVWHFELFMLPLFLLLLIGWNYFQLTSGRLVSNQDLVNMGMADDEEEDEKEPGKKGLMDKIHMVQEIVLIVQNILDEIASIGEQIKNTFNWSVPFLSCLACLVLFVATALLYYIPLRYIVLIWGVDTFTMKLRKPHAIGNNAILDFLKRVPSDVQKVQYSELRAPGIQSPPRRRK